MAKPINTIRDALLYMLSGLWYTETKLKDEFNTCIDQLSSHEVKAALREYIDNIDASLQRLDRVFNHLMAEPVPRKNEVANMMIKETHELLNCTPAGHLKDILMVSCIQNINAYKKASYKSAYLFMIELELDAADLVEKIWESEQQTSQALAALPIHEFNKVNKAS